MLLMLGILTLIYFIALFAICMYRHHINVKICDLLFVLADLVFFFCWNFAGYQQGWLDDGWITLDNISPFIFTLIPLTFLLKDKYKHACYCAIAFLSVGMFFALLVSPEQAYLSNFNTEASFIYTSEAACHLLASLYGFYLVLTDRVKPNFSSWLRSIGVMYGVITLGVVLNFIFHKSFFGMDPYGNASIYFFDIFGSFWATLAAYYLSVAVVLTAGMQASYFIDKLTAKFAIEPKEESEAAEQTTEQETFLV